MSTSVQFDSDKITPITQRTAATPSAQAGGVYTTRAHEGLTSPTLSHHGQLSHEDEEDPEDLKKEGDIKQRQEFRGWLLIWLAYQSTGVIYGDIGTSPLYVFSSTFSSEPAYDDLVGALSLIIWALTIMVTVKYVLIVLRADDEGEGGTFALFSLLSRYANIVKRDPKEESMVNMERHKTNELGRSTRALRTGIEKSPIIKHALKVIGVLGVSLVMADGVLTPAQSVLGAIQGLKVVDDTITTSTIIGVSCAILVLLFLIQPLGITKLSWAFAPVVIVWLSFNASFGIYNLVKYDASVLKAFSPSFSFTYLIRNGEAGWRSLGGILLAFTGCEALFADLGAFSRNSIQLSWLIFVYPTLLLAYIGQAAYISRIPSAYSNPFFNCVPPGMLYPSLVVAILAAIVASQALITSTFQLLSQVMKLSYFPQIKLIHTSKEFHGQIYIPWANWLLMVGTVIVTAVYNNTTSLGNAYGVCVILVTFITTCMVSLVALIIWRLNPFIVAPLFLIFAAFDGAFLSSVLTKVPEGAWFTLVLAFVLCTIFILWRFGKEQQWHAESDDRISPSSLVSLNSSGILSLTPAFGGGSLTQIKGFAIFFDKAGNMTPTVFIHFLSKFVAAPEAMVFFHLRPLPTPSVPAERRYTVSATPVPNCYRLVIRHGYTDEVISENLAQLVYEQVRAFIIQRGAGRQNTLSSEMGVVSSRNIDGVLDEKALTQAQVDILGHEFNSHNDNNDNGTSASTSSSNPSSTESSTPRRPSAAEQLVMLDAAYRRQVLYIMGKEQMRIRARTNLFRRVALNAFLWIRDNTRSKMAALRIPVDQLVEVGFVKEV